MSFVLEIFVAFSNWHFPYAFRFTSDGNEDIDDLKLCNDPSDSHTENLIQLPHLHEPAILFCLEKRYEKSDIYTYTGSILIAVNPFKSLPIYDNSYLESYFNYGLLKYEGFESSTHLPPHVFAVADGSYRGMMSVIHSAMDGETTEKSPNQSILISGESGAGYANQLLFFDF